LLLQKYQMNQMLPEVPDEPEMNLKFLRNQMTTTEVPDEPELPEVPDEFRLAPESTR
jgi:hypothetical protein